MCNFERTKFFHNIFGDNGIKVTPLPIPNRIVKLYYADGTARETVWESRKSPNNLFTRSYYNEICSSFFLVLNIYMPKSDKIFYFPRNILIFFCIKNF